MRPGSGVAVVHEAQSSDFGNVRTFGFVPAETNRPAAYGPPAVASPEVQVRGNGDGKVVWSSGQRSPGAHGPADAQDETAQHFVCSPAM